MDKLTNLRAFLSVAGCGSFSAAARQLGVAPSVVTKRIGELEATARVRLFARTTRKVSLTEAGLYFLPRVRAALLEVEDVFAEMARPREVLEGHLRVKVPTTLGVLFLGPILARFQAEHPRVSIEVVLADRPVNPAEEGFDVAVTVFPAAFAEVAEEMLCPLQRLVCASPGYVAAHGQPQHPRDLASHATLSFQPTGHVWTFQSDHGLIGVDVVPRFSANDSQVLFAAAKQGNGIALLPAYVSSRAIETGELVQLLAGFRIPEIWVKALVPRSRVQIPRVQELVDALKDGLGNGPPWERSRRKDQGPDPSTGDGG